MLGNEDLPVSSEAVSVVQTVNTGLDLRFVQHPVFEKIEILGTRIMSFLFLAPFSPVPEY